jgi:uncharacterized protein YjiS (DUF1127 family)
MMTTATHDMLTDCQALRRSSAPRSDGLKARISRVVGLWRERRRQRQSFDTFGHRELRELGLSRWEVERELAKPFWRG